MDKKLNKVIYFMIDRTHKAMRRYTQKIFKDYEFGITIDQFVLLKLLKEEEGLTQIEMASKLYKDNASVTRIVDLLVGKGYINRNMSVTDRRTFDLSVSEQGTDLIESVFPVIQDIRKRGVKDISKEDMDITMKTLSKIIGQFS